METMEWKKIPKDKAGFFDEDSNLYELLPIVITEHISGLYPILHYVDEDNWHDTLADLSRSRFKYYAQCEVLPEINDD